MKIKTLDEFKLAALAAVAALPVVVGDPSQRAIVAARREAVTAVGEDFVHSAVASKRPWRCRFIQSMLSSNWLQWDDSAEGLERSCACACAMADHSAQCEALTLPEAAPLPAVYTEQGLAALPLPMTFEGQKNPDAISLQAMWLLEYVVDTILKIPEVRTTIDALKKGEQITINPITFTITTDGARKAITKRWTNADQMAALKELKGWWPKSRWVCRPGDPVVRNKKGWKLIETSTSHPFLAAVEERKWERPGRPDSSGQRVNYEITGEIDAASGAILMLQIATGRIFKLPGETYSMSAAAQMLYRQGRFFVRSGSGWVLNWDAACLIAGLTPATGDNRNIARQARKIEAAMDELRRIVGWRRDRRAEEQRLGGQKPRGRNRVWVLREPKVNSMLIGKGKVNRT